MKGMKVSKHVRVYPFLLQQWNGKHGPGVDRLDLPVVILRWIGQVRLFRDRARPRCSGKDRRGVEIAHCWNSDGQGRPKVDKHGGDGFME